MMRIVFALMTAASLILSGCRTGGTDHTANANSSAEKQPPQQATEAPAEPAAVGSSVSLVSLAAGALVVKKPDEFDTEKWSAIRLLDERPESGWSTPKDVVSPQTVVIALPEKTLLKSLTFDTGARDKSGRGAKDISVEVSDTGENDGFQKIADVSLEDMADKQKFAVSSEVPGRWVRLTIKNNHGSLEYTELFDFRATGTQLTQTAFPDVSGTYKTNYGDFHLKQEGSNITGCYEHKGGAIDGGIEGRVIKFVWSQSESKTRGPAIMVFTPDTQQMYGLWWNEGNDSPKGVWNGTKKSSSVGTCANWIGSVEKQLTKEMEEFGRVRVYGINFDVDSDRVRDESKPTIDKVVAMLKAKPDWKITIEGHTDSTSTAQHNQNLSERRAVSVKNQLESAGIEASRLKTIGYGATKPVASNDSELGRAQNRRVELIRQ
ncbi:MAG: OmpA family protein [Acidobacteriota bacterium]